MVNVIDLKFQGFSHAIAAFLLESDDGPVLIETGPHSTFKTLEQSLRQVGYNVTDIQHVLLSHIHFDHAGAAWAFAKHGAKIYLHPSGAKHMEDPTKLYESAKRIYQDKMDILWGKLEPIPKDHLFQIPDHEELTIGGLQFKAHHTPGHAIHHIAWQLEDTVFTGDIAGVKIENGPAVPPCPPPDINIEEWKASIARVKALKPEKLYLTHFGEITDIDRHLSELEACIDSWALWIKEKFDAGVDAATMTPQFQAFVRDQLLTSGLTSSEADRYEAANPAWMSVAGLLRYWRKRSEL